MFINIKGTRIFFDTVGSELRPVGGDMVERPSLVVLHGGPGYDHSLMRPYFDRFSDAYQVIYIDHRGNGRSEGSPDTWNLVRWGDDVDDLCTELGVRKPLVLGFSFGGMVAMSYATSHPEGPSKLVLISTAAKMDLQATYRKMRELGGTNAESVAKNFWTSPSPEWAADYMRVCLPLYNPSGPPSAESVSRAIMRTEVLFHFVAGEQRTMDLTPELKKVKCSTLILAGGLDPITPVACSKSIEAALPIGIAELEVLEDAGHGVHIDQPKRAEEILRRFLK
jgi:pimeloyl-ACP methyl ester carboxylesterase